MARHLLLGLGMLALLPVACGEDDGGGTGGTGAVAGTGGSAGTAGAGTGTDTGTATGAGTGGTAGAGGAGGGGASAGSRCAGLAETCGPSGNESCCATALVPGGTFDRSNDPVYPATVSDFVLDRFEITVGRFRAFVEAGQGTQANPPAEGAGANPNLTGSGWQAAWDDLLVADTAALKQRLMCTSLPYRTWTDEPGENETRPINCLSWLEAFAFCIWDGGRLPTEAEWNYAAAGGSEQREYPWSNPPSSANIDCSHASYGCIDDPCGDGAVGCALTDILAVGSKPAGDSRWGHADLGGNLWEWVLDWYAADYPMPCDDCANLTPAENRGFRGGSFSNYASYLLTSYRGGSNYDPTGRHTGTGARCARSP